MSTTGKPPLHRPVPQPHILSGARAARPNLPLHGVFVVTVLALAGRCSAQQYQPEANYAEANSASSRQYLLGDWFGVRHRLANRGVLFNIESDTDSMGVAHGGISNQAAAFTRIRGTVDIDLDKLTGTSQGLTFHATGLWQTGNNIGAQLGSYADPSGLASVHVFRMDSFWVQKRFAGGILNVRAGQMAGWDFFGNQEYGEVVHDRALELRLGQHI